MQIKKELIKRQIAGEVFLVPVGKSVYQANGLYALTELGSFIWDLLPEVEDPEQIFAAVREEYDVPEAVAREDISQFLEKLRSLQIL